MRKQRRGITILEMMVVVLVLGLLMGFLAAATFRSSGMHCRRQCLNNIRQIALAMQAYAQQYGSYPPAYVVGEDGRPAHSWRVLILPFLDQRALYDSYNFQQRWDGPDNEWLQKVIVGDYDCPESNMRPGYTCYSVVVGERTLFPGAGSVPTDAVRYRLNSTLMVVETNTLSIPWTAPADLNIDRMSLEINEPYRLGIGSVHKDGASAAFADGSIRRLPPTTRPDALRAMLTINGGEAIEMPKSP